MSYNKNKKQNKNVNHEQEVELSTLQFISRWGTKDASFNQSIKQTFQTHVRLKVKIVQHIKIE